MKVGRESAIIEVNRSRSWSAEGRDSCFQSIAIDSMLVKGKDSHAQTNVAKPQSL